MPNRVFIRFPSVNIPSYADVDACFLRVTAFEDNSDVNATLRIGFANEGNPSAPANYSELQAVEVAEWVTWTVSEAWVDGTEYDSPDLAMLLKEIVHRSDWSIGNALLVIIEDASSSYVRRFSAIEYSESERPRLYIDYYGRFIDPEFLFPDGILDFNFPDGTEADRNLWTLRAGSPFFKWPYHNNYKLRFEASSGTGSHLTSDDTLSRRIWKITGDFEFSVECHKPSIVASTGRLDIDLWFNRTSGSYVRATWNVNLRSDSAEPQLYDQAGSVFAAPGSVSLSQTSVEVKITRVGNNFTLQYREPAGSGAWITQISSTEMPNADGLSAEVHLEIQSGGGISRYVDIDNLTISPQSAIVFF